MVVWAATVIGFTRLGPRPPARALGLAAMLGATAVAYALQSSFPGGREFQLDHYQATPLEAELQRAIDALPAQASVVATRRVVPQIAARPDLYQFPFTFYSDRLRPDWRGQDFYVLDLTDSPTRRSLEPGGAESVLEKRPRYHVERLGPSVLRLSRARPEPEVPRSETFGGTLRLIGYEWARSSGRPGTPRSGATASIRLFCEALQRPAGEPTRVLRLVGPSGEAGPEVRGQPLDSYLPVGAWEPGQVVVEQLAFPVPPGGRGYRLLVSWQGADGTPLGLEPIGGSELTLDILE